MFEGWKNYYRLLKILIFVKNMISFFIINIVFC